MQTAFTQIIPRSDYNARVPGIVPVVPETSYQALQWLPCQSQGHLLHVSGLFGGRSRDFRLDTVRNPDKL